MNQDNNTWPIRFNSISNENYGTNDTNRIFNNFELIGIIFSLFSSNIAILNFGKNSSESLFIDPFNIITKKVKGTIIKEIADNKELKLKGLYNYVTAP